MADMAEERRAILRMLEEGRITPEQAAELLRALGAAGGAAAGGPGAARGAGPADGGAGEAGDGAERADVLRWVEQVGNRMTELAEELAERVQRAFSSATAGGRAGEVGERLSEMGERLQEMGRSVADRVAAAFGQVGTAVLPSFTFTEELSGEFGEGVQPQIELHNRFGSITVLTDPEAGRRWRLLVRKHLRARGREEAEQAAARLLSPSHGPSYLSVRVEGWAPGTADMELVLGGQLRPGLKLETASGSVSARGVRAARLEARTVNGRVDLADVEAQRVLVRATNGPLLLERVRADLLEAGSVNGSITAGVGGGDLRLSTVNGSVTARADWLPEGPAHQRLEARALNGAVRVMLPAAAREAAARGELGLVLEAATGWGAARVDVPGAVLVTQTSHLGRQRVVYQSPHLERAPRSLQVEVETRTGSATLAGD